MTLTLLSADYPAQPTKSMTSSRASATVPELTSESAVFAVSAQEHPPTTQLPCNASAPLARDLMLKVTALSDAVSTKFSRTASAAVSLASTPSTEFAVNAPGTKFTIRA
jgi:hypothetical protein